MTTCWGVFSVVGEVEVIFHCHIVVLVRVLNVHIKEVTITTRILLIQAKIYHKSVNKQVTSYLRSDNQKKVDAIFFSDDHEIR